MAQQYYYTESETESDEEPSLDILESKLSDLSINKTSRSSDDDDDDATEEKSYQIVQNIIQGCEVGKLKVEQCKLYLRRHGLRLTGKKDILIHRIKEHLSIINGEGEHKYPASTFLINCKGDACTGDVVMFQQNVYEMFNIASRSASGPPCGQRIVAGRIVNESYGAAKQQHTFTIEVLWSTGTKPLPPLHPLLIKGRNLYRLKTMRQRWEDESERHKILSEKHARGNVARTNRDARLHEKETNKALRASKGNIKYEKLQHKTKTSPTPPIITSLMGMDHRATATYKENMNPNTLRGGVDRKNMGDYYKNENQENKRNPRTSIQHSGAVFMGMDHGAPHNENMNPRDVDGTLRRSFQVEGFCPSRFFQRHDYDPQNLPRSRSFHNNGYLPPRDHYHNQGKRQQLCRYYAQGRCHYGTNCKYLH